jgi:hypothetical protein
MRPVAITLSFVALVVAGCSSSSDTASCGKGGTLTIAVNDSSNEDAPLCDATVTVSFAGGMPQPLSASGPPTSCTFSMPVAIGDYTISASKSGYRPQQTSLHVGTNGCDTDSPSVVLGLVHL